MANKAIILCLFFLFTCCAYAQNTSCFKANAKGDLTLDPNTRLGNNKAFFVGEFHGVYGVPELKLALIKYVQEQYGVRDIFMETGYATAWLYNQYLLTGDTTLFTTPLLTYAQKQPNRDFWRQLYTYNNSLRHKLTIHGIDFERMDFIKALRLLAPTGKAKPTQIKSILTYIDTATIRTANADMHSKDNPGQKLTAIYDSIRKDFIANRQLYKDFYGANFKEAERIMRNGNTFSRYSARNEAMYHNVMQEVKAHKIKRFIIFAGLNHAGMQGGHTLCSRLMNDKHFHHDITTISMLCKDCYDWQQQPKERYAVYRAPAAYAADTATLSAIYQQYYNPACRYTLIPSQLSGSKPITNNARYLILLKDQPEF